MLCCVIVYTAVIVVAHFVNFVSMIDTANTTEEYNFFAATVF